MDRFTANRTPVAGQDTLNPRPLPNLIGHNGPYFGIAEPVEQDAARIEGHSPLFRNLDTFEADLRKAVLWIWDGITAVNRVRAEVEAGEETTEELLEVTADSLDGAFQFLQEALLIAEVLDDRQQRRIRNRERADFLALIATTPRDHMRPLERLAEEGRLTWQIACLMDRLETVATDRKENGRGRWGPDYFTDFGHIVERLAKLASPPTVTALEAMDDDALAAELRELEERAHDTRKTIALIHAIRAVRHA